MPPVLDSRRTLSTQISASQHFSDQLDILRRAPELSAIQDAASSTHSLAKRALRTNVIPLSYNLSGASPGAAVGITLGAVVAFLLIFWLIWFATLGRPSGAIEGDEIVDIHRAHRSDRSRRSRRTRVVRSEVSEETRRSSPPPPRRRTERVLEETTTRRVERSQPPPPPPPMSEVDRERESIYERETERRVEGDDMVEVMEEESTASERPVREKRKSGFRNVDPNDYAGGNFPMREVSRARRSTSRR